MTVVELCDDAQFLVAAAIEIEALCFPRDEVRTRTEPASLDVTGVRSFPWLDLKADLNPDLTRIGRTVPEARAYVEGLRRGGSLPFVTGPEKKVKISGTIMNQYGAVAVVGGRIRQPSTAPVFRMVIPDLLTWRTASLPIRGSQS